MSEMPIDPETLAAYLDGRLPPAERAGVEARLAADEDAYELLVEVMKAQDALGHVGAARSVAPRPHPAWWLGGAAAAAAVVLLAVWLAPGIIRDRTRPEIAAMVAAVNGERYVEPRVTGGFPFGPVRSVTRGSTAPDTRGQGDLSSQNLALLAAVGEAQKRAQAEPTAAHLHAWGVGLMLIGDVDQAIDTLESAAAGAADNADILSDVAAAYAVRGARAPSPRDWSAALDYAERAIRTASPPLEAYFNRALALEALHLDGARQAWQDYLDRDSSSDWSREARQHLAALTEKPQAGTRPANEASLRAALDSGGGLDEAVRRDPQRAREWLEEDLAREWAAAIRAGDTTAATRARERGARLLAAYASISRDTFPAQALTHLWNAAVDRAALAGAVLQFVDAARLVREDRLAESSALLKTALPLLQSANSPLVYWARYFVVLDWSQQGRLSEALSELDRLDAVAAPAGYATLLGTVRNRRGQILGRQGNQEGAIRERRAAIADFARAADVDQVAVMHSMVAEAYRFLGDTRSAWAHHAESLARLERTPNFRSRHLVLVQAGLTSTHEGRYEAALHFQHAVVANGKAWQRASGTGTGLLHEARNAFRLGRLDDADGFIRNARAVVSDIPDAAFRERIELELLEVEGEVFGSREPAAGLPVLARAVDRFSTTGFAVRLSNLLLWRGRLHAKAGHLDAAEADWRRAIDALERERATVSDESLRLAQAGALRALQVERALARVQQGMNGAASLAPIEQGRARTLVEEALDVATPDVDLEELQGRLPDGTGVVHYALSSRMAVAWVTTRQGTTAKPLALDGEAIAQLADRYRRLSARSLTLDATLGTAQELYRALVLPLEPSLAAVRELIVVADPALAGVSFAALNNPASGAYLIESMSVAMAPSATLATTMPAMPQAKAGVLLVGADRPESMPPLPWVTRELDDLRSIHVGATVLTGRDATRERLLAEAPRASVVHVAAHAFGSPVNPLMSRLILHPGRDGRSELYAYELSSLDVSGALVVLAACRTGYAGRDLADDDGVLALARPFLARGARAVVATYRDVSDRGAPVLMRRFHRHVRDGMTPTRAWQMTTIESLRESRESAEWTAYGVFLGRGAVGTAHAGRLTNE